MQKYVCVLGLDDDGDLKGNDSVLFLPYVLRRSVSEGPQVVSNRALCFLKPSGGNKAVVQGNGKVAADAAWSNGYTCRACTLLSERQDTLRAHGAASRVYSRDRSQKRKSHSLVEVVGRVHISSYKPQASASAFFLS